MRGRPPAVPATAIVEEVRLLIARAAGEPCPTVEYMAAQAGVDWRIVNKALQMLCAAGELETHRTAWVGGLRRRMRVRVGGVWSRWTDLTRRGAYPVLQRDHREAVMAVGRF